MRHPSITLGLRFLIPPRIRKTLLLSTPVFNEIRNSLGTLFIITIFLILVLCFLRIFVWLNNFSYGPRKSSLSFFCTALQFSTTSMSRVSTSANGFVLSKRQFWLKYNKSRHTKASFCKPKDSYNSSILNYLLKAYLRLRHQKDKRQLTVTLMRLS